MQLSKHIFNLVLFFRIETPLLQELEVSATMQAISLEQQCIAITYDKADWEATYQFILNPISFKQKLFQAHFAEKLELIKSTADRQLQR